MEACKRDSHEGEQMTKIADKIREAENNYKQVFAKRTEEREKEQHETKIHNVNIQIAGEAKAMRKKIIKRREKGKTK